VPTESFKLAQHLSAWTRQRVLDVARKKSMKKQRGNFECDFGL
jgi:hypothetical protein